MVKETEIKTLESGEKVKVDPREELKAFLQRISNALKNSNTTAFPPTNIAVADEIDEYVRKLGNEVHADNSKVKKTETRRDDVYL